MFEDLHWIDDETQALLNLLAASIGTARVLMAVNYRPQYTHGWGSKSHYTQLRLDPLGKESAQEMLRWLLGDGAELAALRRLIINKTEATRSSWKKSCRRCSSKAPWFATGVLS
jgi:predicted ATPase